MKKVFLFSAFAVLLAGCSENVISFKDKPITVTADVDGMQTRSGYEGTLVLPKVFYLTITQNENEAEYNYTNVEMKKGNSNQYTTGENIRWQYETNPSPLFVSAYTINGTEVTVDVDQTTGEKVTQNDLLGAVSTTSGDISIKSANVAVNFRHMLCKLDITFSWGEGLKNATNKEITKVLYQGFGTSALLNRTSASIITGATDTTDDISASLSKVTENGEVKNYSEAIFAPKAVEPKILITTLVDDVERMFVYKVTLPEGGFVSGYRYTMDVSIDGTAVEEKNVESVAALIVGGWGNPVAGGDLTTN